MFFFFSADWLGKYAITLFKIGKIHTFLCFVVTFSRGWFYNSAIYSLKMQIFFRNHQTHVLSGLVSEIQDLLQLISNIRRFFTDGFQNICIILWKRFILFITDHFLGFFKMKFPIHCYVNSLYRGKPNFQDYFFSEIIG